MLVVVFVFIFSNAAGCWRKFSYEPVICVAFMYWEAFYVPVLYKDQCSWHLWLKNLHVIGVNVFAVWFGNINVVIRSFYTKLSNYHAFSQLLCTRLQKWISNKDQKRKAKWKRHTIPFSATQGIEISIIICDVLKENLKESKGSPAQSLPALIIITIGKLMFCKTTAFCCCV